MKAIIDPSIASKVYPSPPIQSRRQWKRENGSRSMRLSVLRSSIGFTVRGESIRVSRGVRLYPRGGKMTQILFRNFRMLDPERDELVGGCELLVEGETIREVSERPIRVRDAAIVDCGGRTLMP